MLYWKSLFLLFLLVGFFSIIFMQQSLFFLILHSEILLLIVFLNYLLLTIFYDLYWCVLLSFCILIVGSLELALNLLILAI